MGFRSPKDDCSISSTVTNQIALFVTSMISMIVDRFIQTFDCWTETR